MEVMVVPMEPATSPQDFHFGSSGTAPYASAPSSPRPFGNPEELYYCYTSAPSSPARAATVYSYLARDMDDLSLGVGGRGGGQQELISTPDELFDKGRVRPRAAPRLEMQSRGGADTCKTKVQVWNERGSRERDFSSSSTSVSPLRGEGASPSTSTFVKSSGTGRKWSLKDLLLFRSASEGRATGRGSKDPLRKYTLLSSSFNKRRPRPGGDQYSNKSSSASFKSLDSIKLRGGASSGPAMSAHELHYTANRAASEELKKKTPLPFHRNSLFGCLHFNPAVRSIARGFNASSFNRRSF